MIKISTSFCFLLKSALLSVSTFIVSFFTSFIYLNFLFLAVSIFIASILQSFFHLIISFIMAVIMFIVSFRLSFNSSVSSLFLSQLSLFHFFYLSILASVHPFCLNIHCFISPSFHFFRQFIISLSTFIVTFLLFFNYSVSSSFLSQHSLFRLFCLSILASVHPFYLSILCFISSTFQF